MNRLLATDAVYLGANWPFGINVIVRDAKKTNVVCYPGWHGPRRMSKMLGGEVLGIPRGAPNKALALKMIRYLLSREVQQKLVTKMGWPSARSDAYGEVAAWQRPYFAAVNEALKFAEVRPNLPHWATIDRSINDAFREIVIEGKPLKPTLDKYHQVIADARRRDRARR